MLSEVLQMAELPAACSDLSSLTILYMLLSWSPHLRRCPRLITVTIATSNCRGDGVQQITGDYRARWIGAPDGNESSTRNSDSLSGTGGLWGDQVAPRRPAWE